MKGFGEDQPPKASIKPSIDGAPLTVLATPSSETGVGVLFRAKTANAKIEEWKPLGAFPAWKRSELTPKRIRRNPVRNFFRCNIWRWKFIRI